MDARLAQSEFIGGDRYSIAHMTTLVSVDFARRVRLSVPDEYRSSRRWHAQLTARASAKA
jgi:glutathione S-transferase